MLRRQKIEYKTPAQIRIMRRAGLVVADIHAALRAAIRPGVTTADLDAVSAQVIARHGARSNFLNYHGFPATVCISVNEEIVHGIPGGRILERGDVVSFDCGAVVDGWHGDAACTVVVGGRGAATSRDVELVDVTERAMWAGIAALAAPGARLGAVGAAVEDTVEEHAAAGGARLSIVREYVGHGIGTAMHQDPEVLHHRTRERGVRVRPGLCVCVEPMIVSGSAENRTLDDDWSEVTTDGSRAAHWEHTVAVHDGGVWVLTSPDGGRSGLAPFGIIPAPLEIGASN